MAVMSNKRTGKATLHYTANTTDVVVGTNGVSAIAGTNETVTGAIITQVVWGLGGAADGVGYWTIKRGTNVVAVLSGTGKIDFIDAGVPITLFPTETLVVERTGSTTGFIVVEVQKTSTISDSQYSTPRL
jgi:hypothetical protein